MTHQRFRLLVVFMGVVTAAGVFLLFSGLLGRNASRPAQATDVPAPSWLQTAPRRSEFLGQIEVAALPPELDGRSVEIRTQNAITNLDAANGIVQLSSTGNISVAHAQELPTLAWWGILSFQPRPWSVRRQPVRPGLTPHPTTRFPLWPEGIPPAADRGRSLVLGALEILARSVGTLV